MSAMDMDMPMPKWHWMWDGVVFGGLDQQGSARGGKEFASQNWAMFMGQRGIGSGVFGVNAMVSLEPATLGVDGYREIFQHGEALRGLPVVDRQHPHDAFMQLDAFWRQPFGKTSLILNGGPSSSAALGPLAFSHRISAAENPTAPLMHHTSSPGRPIAAPIDSTHVTFGVVTAGVQRGWFLVEASAFHGREPDWKRWGFNFGKFDSASARLTIRPNEQWSAQVSRGRLNEPEELEPGDQIRTNASVSYLKTRGNGRYTAFTVATGRVTRTYSWTGGLLAEATHWMGDSALYGRFEGTGLEVEHLMFPGTIHKPHPGELVDPIYAYTLGGVRRLWKKSGVDVAVGADITSYTPPARLVPYYGNHPVSTHVFFRIRPWKNAPIQMDRMTTMPMDMSMDHAMPMDHSQH